MKHIIHIPLADGNSFCVAVDEPEAEDTIDIGLKETVHWARQTFEASLDTVLPVSKILNDKLRHMSNQPDEVEVGFGINLSLEAGAFIASASTEANFTVLLRWSKDTTTHAS